MIQIIGLMVAVYALIRLFQAPFHYGARREVEFPAIQWYRLVISLASIVGIFAIAILAILLQGSNTPRF
jgi:hypothetical protein